MGIRVQTSTPYIHLRKVDDQIIIDGLAVATS